MAVPHWNKAKKSEYHVLAMAGGDGTIENVCSKRNNYSNIIAR